MSHPVLNLRHSQLKSSQRSILLSSLIEFITSSLSVSFIILSLPHIFISCSTHFFLRQSVPPLFRPACLRPFITDPSDQQSEWLYFHRIAMVINRVINHHIAGVTDQVINPELFFFFLLLLKLHGEESKVHVGDQQLTHACTHTCTLTHTQQRETTELELSNFITGSIKLSPAEIKIHRREHGVNESTSGMIQINLP